MMFAECRSVDLVELFQEVNVAGKQVVEENAGM